MTEHNHTTLVKGCFRCELGKDEMAAIEEENDKVLAQVMRRILATDLHAELLLPYKNDTNHWISLDGRLKLSEEEFDILTDVQDGLVGA